LSEGHPAASRFLILSFEQVLCSSLIAASAVRIHPNAADPSTGNTASAIQTFHPMFHRTANPWLDRSVVYCIPADASPSLGNCGPFALAIHCRPAWPIASLLAHWQSRFKRPNGRLGPDAPQRRRQTLRTTEYQVQMRRHIQGEIECQQRTSRAFLTRSLRSLRRGNER